jgi:hypothetical protein
VHHHEGRHGDREEQDVEAVHLAEVQHVEERAHSDGVHGVLGVDRDPLGIEVLLRHVSRERRDDADREDDHPDHPGRRSPVAPAGCEVLTPQVQHHEDEEDLDRPEMQRIHEVPDV